MLSLCLNGVPPGLLVSSHFPKTRVCVRARAVSNDLVSPMQDVFPAWSSCSLDSSWIHCNPDDAEVVTKLQGSLFHNEIFRSMEDKVR